MFKPKTKYLLPLQLGLLGGLLVYSAILIAYPKLRPTQLFNRFHRKWFFHSQPKPNSNVSSSITPNNPPAKPQESPIPKPIANETAPLICGNIPEGWKVEVLSEVTIKEGPIHLLNSKITLVVPLYQLVPIVSKVSNPSKSLTSSTSSSNISEDCIIIEPGYKSKSAEPRQETLSSILHDQVNSLHKDQERLEKIVSNLNKLSQLPQAKNLNY